MCWGRLGRQGGAVARSCCAAAGASGHSAIEDLDDVLGKMPERLILGVGYRGLDEHRTAVALHLTC